MTFVCEVVVNGRPCGDAATHLYRTPSMMRYLCDLHADEYHSTRKSNVRVPMIRLDKLTFTCDWAGDGDAGTCGMGARWYQNHPDGYQRPLCTEHAADVEHAAAVTPEHNYVAGMGAILHIFKDGGGFTDGFDPKKVPYKPEVHVPRYLSAPPKPAEASHRDHPMDPSQDAYYEAMGAEIEAHPIGGMKPPSLPSMVPTSPLPPPPGASRQPKSIKSALAELAATVLDEAKRRVERWR